MPGAVELLCALRGSVEMAIASGSPPEAIRIVEQKFGWSEYFDVMVSSEEVAKGKPEPDVFIAAANRAGVRPENALVIEDSLHGVFAAKRAGMTCFVVPSSDNPEIAANADECFPDLHAIAARLPAGSMDR
jgi:HAD superfamily hydrolase (TIGR01509 family)